MSNQTTTVPQMTVEYGEVPLRGKVLWNTIRRALLMIVAAIDAYLAQA